MKTNECTSLEDAARKAVSDMKAALQAKSEAVMREDELRSDNKELDKECQDMSEKLRFAANKVNDLKGKLAAKTLEADRAGEGLRRTTNELNRVRTDAENMVSVMDGMEKQLTEFQTREEGVSQLSRECKEKVEDAILARDQANAICTSLRREVAKLLEQRKKVSSGGLLVGLGMIGDELLLLRLILQLTPPPPPPLSPSRTLRTCTRR